MGIILMRKLDLLLIVVLGWIVIGCGCAQKSTHKFVVEDAESYKFEDGTIVSLGSYQGSNRQIYRLENGTELLAEDEFFDPQSFVENNSLPLSSEAQANIVAFYEQQGPLYHLETYLELAYEEYCDDESKFECWLLSQNTIPSAASETVIYCTTELMLPLGEGNYDTYSLTQAFDKETGTALDSWELFSVDKNTLKEQLLLTYGIDAVAQDSFKVAFHPSYIRFREDGFEVILPSLDNQGNVGFGGNYEELSNVMNPWAIPTQWY